MDLTTLARVKSALPIASADTADDAEIGKLIASVSRRMEEAMWREAQLIERTEVQEVEPGMGLFSLRCAPVESVSSLKVAATQDWASAEELEENTDYILQRDLGLVRLLFQLEPLRTPNGRAVAPCFARAVYVGGWSTDAGKLEGIKPDLVQAATLQVCHLYKRRSTPGGNLQVAGGSGLEFANPEYDLLAEVRAVCARERRRRG